MARRDLLDIIYACFIAAGVAMIMITVVEAVRDGQELSEETADRVGFLLLFPFSAGVFTGSAAVILSLVAWREWPLLVLSFLALLIVTAAVLNVGPSLVYFLLALYTVGCIWFSVRWFLIRRRRHL